MGKKRRPQAGTPKQKVDDTDSNDEDVDIFTDEINNFTQARNKIDLDEREKASSDEEELFGLVNESDESDEEMGEWSKRLKQVKFQARLDKKKALPETLEKSWGTKRGDFYGSGIRRKPKTTEHDEEDEWVMEAQEIERLQKKMDEDMDEEDFLVPGLIQKATQAESATLNLKSALSEKEKQELQSQHHPEMDPLRDEMSKCISMVENLQGFKGWRVQSMDLVYRMYGAHIAFYLHLLETGEDTRGHPVLGRLLQWKKLVKVYEGFPAEWLEASEGEEDDSAGEGEEHRLPFGDDSEEEGEKEGMEEEGDEDELTSRPVTYEIEKNKPKKKSAPNNPRVKHREKFRKAKIRRRGKIRDYKPEVNKYRGEASGIRSGITRSTRLK